VRVCVRVCVAGGEETRPTRLPDDEESDVDANATAAGDADTDKDEAEDEAEDKAADQDAAGGGECGVGCDGRSVCDLIGGFIV